MAIERFTNQNHYWPESKGPKDGFLSADTGYQVTFNHDVRHLGQGDNGGPWLLEKSSDNYNFGFISKNGYKGSALPWDNNSFGNPFIGLLRSDASYNADGAKAIAATEPTAAVFNGSQAIGEAVYSVDNGIPSVPQIEFWKNETERFKRMRVSVGSDDYVNYQFGWLPLASDISDFGYSVSNVCDIVDNYRHHANVGIKRSLELRHDITTQAETRNDFVRTYGLHNVGSTETNYFSTLDERVWFVGKYTYYMPVDGSMYSRLKRYKAYARKLFGVELTPETVWNVSPWSWAADYKADVGSIIHNWSAIGHNGLVLQYGYIMHSQESVWNASSRYGNTNKRIARYRRVAADPYGFGVSPGSLSTQQTAILASLGLSRKARITIK